LVDLVPDRDRWYHSDMKYLVEIPEELERQLLKKAQATGDDVVHLIRVAVGRFVNDDILASPHGEWSDELEARRRELIDKDIAGSISQSEAVELTRLDRLANEHFDRVCPPPIDGALQLHDRLLKQRGQSGN
jgi:hypothetical protein